MRSLKKKTDLKKILALVKKVRRKSQIPILLMGYLNPILSYGLSRFAIDAKSAGVDGTIIPDLPPDEGGEIAPVMARHGLDLVYLLAPTSSPQRQKRVARASRGFIYYVSITGITGAKQSFSGAIHSNVKSIKRFSKLPVCVGFGISNPAQAKAAARSADGVIVGSAVVRALTDNPKMTAAHFSAKFIRPFSAALGKRK